MAFEVAGNGTPSCVEGRLKTTTRGVLQPFSGSAPMIGIGSHPRNRLNRDGIA